MTTTKEREVLLKVIEMYKAMPYLWQKTHQDYMNKDIRDEGFNVLIKIYREFDEQATLKFLKKKIENMRTGFAREYKKVVESQRSGSDRVYVPTLYYYEALQFLGDHTDIRIPMKDTLETEGHSSQYSSDGESDYQRTYVSSTQKKKRTAQSTAWTQATILAEENITETSDQLQQLQHEKWEAIGRSIGLQLRDLDRSQRTVAHKLINDIMYYAESGLLSPCSSVSLDPLTRQTISVYESPSRDSKDHILTVDDPLVSFVP